MLGAAKLAANLSTTFRAKVFGMADSMMCPVFPLAHNGAHEYPPGFAQQD